MQEIDAERFAVEIRDGAEHVPTIAWIPQGEFEVRPWSSTRDGPVLASPSLALTRLRLETI